MRPKTQLRALPLALALTAALALAGPAAAAGRTPPSPLAQLRAWMAESLPGWLRLDAWTDGLGATTAGAENEAGHTIDPDGLGATTTGTENEHGHGIDPNG